MHNACEWSLNRRQFLKSGLSLGAGVATLGPALILGEDRATSGFCGTLTFVIFRPEATKRFSTAHLTKTRRLVMFLFSVLFPTFSPHLRTNASKFGWVISLEEWQPTSYVWDQAHACEEFAYPARLCGFLWTNQTCNFAWIWSRPSRQSCDQVSI